MGFLARIAWGRRSRAVATALDGAAKGRVAVVGAPGLARVLGEGGITVVPFATGQMDGVVSTDASEQDLAAWVDALGDGGVIAIVGRVPREEMTRRVLCAGLVDVSQHVAGRAVVTSGRVKKI
jgi:hypothetical protein